MIVFIVVLKGLKELVLKRKSKTLIHNKWWLTWILYQTVLNSCATLKAIGLSK